MNLNEIYNNKTEPTMKVIITKTCKNNIIRFMELNRNDWLGTFSWDIDENLFLQIYDYNEKLSNIEIIKSIIK